MNRPTTREHTGGGKIASYEQEKLDPWLIPQAHDLDFRSPIFLSPAAVLPKSTKAGFMSFMLLNIMHRSATGPKYSIFREQQRTIHDLGIKGTVFLHYRDLFDETVLQEVLRDREEFGDEIGLALHDMGGPGLDEIVGNLPAVWLLDKTRKREAMDKILTKYREVVGELPASIASYHFDSSSLRILRELAPSAETVVGGCFEEGVRVFHGCNHSWYLFNEGMPWNPWYPSKGHSLRPAVSEDDAAGVVAVPHLVRDMSLSYEGRNDFWASHPPNVVRGMGNDASFNPYDLNLIDQYRMQEDYNGGYSYLNSFVGVNWLTWNHNSEYPPEVCWQLYRTFLNYLVELKDQGSVQDLTLSEYGKWHRENRPYADTQSYLAKEMLYGSGKHYFWFIDGEQRYLVDPTQGGSVGDLRSYAGRYDAETGPDTPNREIGSYPYLVQSQHRSGYAHHHEDGARTSLFVEHDGESIDLAGHRTKVADVQATDTETTLTLTPVELAFASGLTATLTTTYTFVHNQGETLITRELSNLSNESAELILTEHFKGAPGKTEYAEDLTGIVLYTDVAAAGELDFDYAGQPESTDGDRQIGAKVPQANTRLELSAVSGSATGASRKCGNLFSPYFTLQLLYTQQGNGSIRTKLSLAQL